jgi:hypothetical protein
MLWAFGVLSARQRTRHTAKALREDHIDPSKALARQFTRRAALQLADHKVHNSQPEPMDADLEAILAESDSDDAGGEGGLSLEDILKEDDGGSSPLQEYRAPQANV